MASVEWTNDVILSDLDDPSDSVSFPASSISDTTARQARVQTFAAGRRRAITGPAVSQSVTVTARRVSPTVQGELRDRLGTVQWYRDSRGRRFPALCSTMSGGELRGEDYLDTVTLVFTAVDTTEAV